MKTHFHMNGFAPRLALKKRYKTTWKWPLLGKIQDGSKDGSHIG